jgi:hypothetical protein
MTRNAAVWNFEKAPYSHLGIKTKLRNVATWCRSLPSQNKSGSNNIIYSIKKMNLNKSTKQLVLSKEMSIVKRHLSTKDCTPTTALYSLVNRKQRYLLTQLSKQRRTLRCLSCNGVF